MLWANISTWYFSSIIWYWFYRKAKPWASSKHTKRTQTIYQITDGGWNTFPFIFIFSLSLPSSPSFSSTHHPTDIRPPVLQDVPKLTTYLMMILNFWSSCFCLPSAGNTAMYPYAQFCGAGDRTEGLVYARQTFYQLSYVSSSKFLRYCRHSPTNQA